MYFSIIPHPGGFSAQLLQFNSYYKLGKALDMDYYHQEFFSARTDGIKKTKGNSIFDFLGINQYFLERNPTIQLEQFKIVQIPLDFYTLKLSRVNSFEKLKKYVLKKIQKFQSPDLQLLLVFSMKPAKPTNDGIVRKTMIVALKFLNRINPYGIRINKYLWLFKLINSEETLIRPELLILYRKSLNVLKRQKKSINSVFVHIRRGDTAIIKTKSKKFVSVLPSYRYRFRPFTTIQEVNLNYISSDSYFQLLEKVQLSNKSGLNLFLFSDGFHRTSIQIDAFLENVDAENQTIADLNEWNWESYQKEEFAQFDTLTNCQQIIGESQEKLQNLIVELFNSKVVICGSNLRMIPQLISILFTKETMPILIVVCASKEPNFELIGLNSINEKVFMVHVDERFDDDCIAVSNFLSKSSVFDQNEIG
ncbi:MAG: hypothetical protein RIG77_11650 [Cyclobacteriaceae bacterium]